MNGLHAETPISFGNMPRERRAEAAAMALRQVATLQADGTEVARVLIETAAHGPKATVVHRYELARLPVSIKLHDPTEGELAAVFARQANAIAAYDRQCRGARTITRLDAVVARLLGLEANLRHMAARTNEPMTIVRYAASPVEGVSIGSHSFSCRTLGRHSTLTMTRSRITVQAPDIGPTRNGGAQSWANGCLLIATPTAFPATLVAAMRGRRLDDVVSGTALADMDLVIAKAWNAGGKLGFSFASDLVTVAEALGRAVRKAA